MKRHRDEQCVVIPGALERRHIAGHRAGKSNLAAIFKVQGDGARQVAIGHCGSNAMQPRRLGQAPAAAIDLRCKERQAATHAPVVAQPFRLVPTGWAESAGFGDHLAAARATWRQCKVDDDTTDRTKRIKQPTGHCPLVAGDDPTHKRPRDT